MTYPRLSLVLALLSIAACFEGGDDDEVGDETETTDTTDTTDTTETGTESSTDTTSESTTEALPEPPVIDSFTVAGSDTPNTIIAAGSVPIEVSASDPDGEVVEVRLYRDDQLFASLPAPGPYTGEFVVGGELFDGSYEFRAIAVDDDGLETEAPPITLAVDVPAGGLVETWTFDSGGADSAWRVAVDPDGTQVIAGGTTYLMNDTRARVDRLVGGGWTDKVEPLAFVAAGLALRPDGTLAMAGWTADNESVAFLYDQGGAQQLTQTGHWTPQNIPDANFEAPLDAVADADGNVYVAGMFNADQGSAMMLLKFDTRAELAWARYGTNTMLFPDGQPYSLKLDIHDDDLVVSGYLAEISGMTTNTRMWMANFGVGGNLVGQVVVPGFEGNAFAVGIGSNDEVMVGGSRFVDGGDNQAWFARYTLDGQPLWIKDEGNPGIGAVIATDIDAWGESVVVTVESCESGFLAVVGCDLFVRKYDEDGVLLWEVPFADGKFAGPSIQPLIGDLEIDRFGYVYVAAGHIGPTDADWWISKLHP